MRRILSPQEVSLDSNKKQSLSSYRFSRLVVRKGNNSRLIFFFFLDGANELPFPFEDTVR
jgi:hypothetical protein